jgi:hypothetical protein
MLTLDRQGHIQEVASRPSTRARRSVRLIRLGGYTDDPTDSVARSASWPLAAYSRPRPTVQVEPFANSKLAVENRFVHALVGIPKSDKSLHDREP